MYKNGKLKVTCEYQNVVGIKCGYVRNYQEGQEEFQFTPSAKFNKYIETLKTKNAPNNNVSNDTAL